jgi:hypothetical protein
MEVRMNGFIRFFALAPLVATLAWPASAIGNPLLRPNSVTIMGDRGGEVIRYAIKVKQYEKQGRQVRFAGRCSSACTLYLSLPASQTCIAPGANFGFHKAYGASARGNRTANAFLMRNYPSWVRHWITDNGGLTSSIKTMDYEYAAQHLPKCQTGNA